LLDDLSENEGKANGAAPPAQTESPKGERDAKGEAKLPSQADAGTSGTGDAQPEPGDGCSTATRIPADAANVLVGGERPPWTNPINAKTADGQNAIVALQPDKPSDRLNVASFGFQIPANATIKGVLVEVIRSSITGTVQDNNVNLEVAQDERVPPKKVSSTTWTTATTTARYGALDDTWGVALTPAMINAGIFGFNIGATQPGRTATANVDEVKMSVRYCVP